MKKRHLKVIIIILLLIIILALILFVLHPILTGKAIITQYSFTKAVCNSSNSCQDYVYTCKSNETASISITGLSVQMPEDWKDTRTKEQIEKSCKSET